MPSHKQASIRQLLKDLEDAEEHQKRARKNMIDAIRARLDDAGVAPSHFSAVTGINKGNLYNLLSLGKWNSRIVMQCAELLWTPIRKSELVEEEVEDSDSELNSDTDGEE